MADAAHRRPLVAARDRRSQPSPPPLSPPGRAVIADVREARRDREGRESSAAEASAFSLPAEGRVLVIGPDRRVDRPARTAPSGDSATSTRRRGHRRGALAVASARSRLAAFNPTGEIRWALARPRVHDARWSPGGVADRLPERVEPPRDRGRTRPATGAWTAQPTSLPPGDPAQQPVVAYVSADGA